jgi:hypothetical protein
MNILIKNGYKTEKYQGQASKIVMAKKGEEWRNLTLEVEQI